MTEQLTNINWMVEEIDFGLPSALQPAALAAVQGFLEGAGVTGLNHSIYPAWR